MAIPNQTTLTHHIGEVKQEFHAGMRSEDFPFVANLLINLYSDPVKAVVREYATNALDSHIEAGTTQPVQVTLPSADNLELIIQDYGLGMSIDDLRDTYSMYARSTKRGSNDVVGQLGVGSKSGLTYCDAFTITAVKDGVKCVAMSTKDEHGLGVIKVLDTVGTTEPNGVRITIPVKYHDVWRFNDAAESLFQFWDHGEVLVNGKAPEIPEWRKQALAIDDDTFVVPPSTGLYESYVIMGNVAYAVPDAVVEGVRGGSDTYYQFVARINLGDVDFVPSREAVNHTPWTDETLSDLNDYITANFDRVLTERLAAAESRWDETQLKVLWKGSSVRLNASPDMPIWDYTPTGHGRQARAHLSYRYSLLTDSQLITITKFPYKSLATAHRRRLKEFAPDSQRFIIVPSGVDASPLSGRENTFEWDEVVDETAVATDPVTGKRVKRDETKYTVIGSDSMTAGEIAALGGKVFLLQPKERVTHGNMDGTLVRMYSVNQQSRLRRLVPGIVDYADGVRKLKEAAAAALTDYDRSLFAAAQLDRPWSKLDPSLIDDDILAEAIRLHNTPRTDTLSKALELGIHIGLPEGEDPNEISQYLKECYPLINQRDFYYGSRDTLGSEIIFYVNTKHAALAAQAKESETALDAVAS